MKKTNADVLARKHTSLEPTNSLCNSDLLILATMEGEINAIRRLLERGADPNFKRRDGSTALTWAESDEVISLLLQYGARLDSEMPVDGFTSLHKHATSGCESTIRLLVAAPGFSTVVEWLDEFYQTPLMRAVENSHPVCVTLLLEAGASVNSCDTDYAGPTALQLAAENQDLKMCSILLTYGASPHFSTGLNPTPLEISQQIGNNELVQLFSSINVERP